MLNKLRGKSNQAEIISLAFKLVPKNLPPAFVHGRVEAGDGWMPVSGCQFLEPEVVLTMDNQRSWETVTDDLGVFSIFRHPCRLGPY